MDEEKARRARAAWAYSRKTQRAFANDAGIGYDRLRAILSASNRSPDPDTDELNAIADAATVPREFMDAGFQPAASETDERFARIESEIRRLGVGLSVVSAEVLRRRQGRTERDDTGHPEQDPGDAGQ